MARNKTLKPLTEAPPEPDSSDESSSSSTEDENHQPPHQQPNDDVSSSSGSSTDDDNNNDDNDEDDEEEDDDEEEQQQQQQTPVTPPPSAPSAVKKSTTTTTTTKKPPSDDTSSEDEPEPPVSKLKSIKPTIETSKPRSKPTTAEKRPPPPSSETDTSSKKPKKDKPSSGPVHGPTNNLVTVVATPVVQEEGKKVLFQRIFSNEDEIVILKGIIEFRAKKGADAMNDVDEFYNFIKKSLSSEVSKGQVMDKVRRLKKKYMNAKKKKLTHPHDVECFNLSKKVWGGGEVDEEEEERVNGNGIVSAEKVKSNTKPRSLKIVRPKAKEEEREEEEEEEVVYESGELVQERKMREKGLRKMGGKARAELEEMWNKVAEAEMEVKMMRAEANAEETRRIREALGLRKKY